MPPPSALHQKGRLVRSLQRSFIHLIYHIWHSATSRLSLKDHERYTFKIIQYIKADMRTQLQILMKGDVQNFFRQHQDNGINVSV